jgi:hypothetical protein
MKAKSISKVRNLAIEVLRVVTTKNIILCYVTLYGLVKVYRRLVEAHCLHLYDRKEVLGRTNRLLSLVRYGPH